jgi:hypothetical protein
LGVIGRAEMQMTTGTATNINAGEIERFMPWAMTMNCATQAAFRSIETPSERVTK